MTARDLFEEMTGILYGWRGNSGIYFTYNFNFRINKGVAARMADFL
jgi:hypothetical protein